MPQRVGDRLRALKRRLALLRYLAAVRDRPRPPTMREMGQVADISSTSVVTYNLAVLERDGLIRWERGIKRGIAVTAVGLRHLGLDPAGRDRQGLPPRDQWPFADLVVDCYWRTDAQGRRNLCWVYEE
jgi:SOS-response transcriptional repressor LexA